MKRLPLILQILLFFYFINPATLSAQNYFRVIGGIPHLPVLDPSSLASPFPGMLVYSTAHAMPVMYNGASWESLCSGNFTGAASAVSFEVRKGIPYLPVLNTDPAVGAAGSIYLSATQHAMMVRDNTGWSRLSHMQGKNSFAPGTQFSTSSSLKITKLPVLANDPFPAGLTAGALYFNSSSASLRYYSGSLWKDLRCTALIQTMPVTLITGSKAFTGARIINIVGSAVTTQGLCWGLTANPVIETSSHTTNQNSAGFPAGDFPATITGLSANTTYHVRAYAINSAGIVYGEDLTFTTQNAELPTISTICPPGNITPTQADGGGDVTDWGGARINKRGIYLSSSPLYKDAPYQDPQAYKSNDGSGQGPFPSGLTALLTNTTYYFQAYAENRVGTGYGPVCTFTTPPPSPPVLSSPTVNITNITDNSATGEVIIINNGGSPVLERGIRYSTDRIHWTNSPSTTLGPSDIGTFTANLNGLIPGTLYYVQAYATNSIGTAYSAESSFVTSSLPTVHTLEAFNYDAATFRWGSMSSLDGTVAVVTVQVISTGISALTEYGVSWSTDPAFDPLAVPPAQKNSRTGGGAGVFYLNLKGLLPNTTYYAKAFAGNILGSASGEVVSFTTPDKPAVSTQSASDPAAQISNTTIITGGRVLTDGGVPVNARGICWAEGTDHVPDLNDHYTVNGSGLSLFTALLKNLKGNTTYTVCAYATNNVGTSYGLPVTMTTSAPEVPALSTNAVYNIGGNTAMGGGFISSDGGAYVETRGICWNTDGDPTIDKDSFTPAGEGIGGFNAAITALSPNVWYHVRAYAKNSAGPVMYGNDVKFRTFTLPTLVTIGTIAGSVTSTSAQVEGAILVDGGSKITASGLCYGTASQPTLADEHTTGGPGTGNFIHTLNGLMGNTTYTVRTYAVNGAGTAYANDVPEITFTTAPPEPPSLLTVAASAVTGNSAVSGGVVSSNGGALLEEVGVCWSTKKGFDPATESLGKTSQKSSGSFSTTLTGLLPGTVYYIRAYARNAAGTAFGPNELSFTTLSLATVSTDLLVSGSVTATSALVQGTVSKSGGSFVSRNGICWSSTNPLPSVADSVSKPTGSGTGTFTAPMSELMGNTTYFVRAYATNNAGTAYGDPAILFKTAPAVAPVVLIFHADFPSRTETSISAAVSSNGGGHVGTRGVVWSTDPLADPSAIQTERTARTGYGTGEYNSILTGLTPGTVYYAWAYAVSDETGPVYSDVFTFKTPEPPLVTTLMPVYGNTTASLGGMVIDEGGLPLETTGFAWSTTPIADLDAVPASNKIILAGTGNFSAKLTGLKPQTKYYLIAFASNMMGIGKGQQLSFTTDLAALPIVSTTDATNIGGTLATLGGIISDNGGADIIDRGIIFSTQKDFDPLAVPPSNKISLSGPATGGSFSNTLLGLSRGTVYYFMAYAESNVGKVLGQQKEFRTLDAPSVETWADISSDPAKTLIHGGNITADGGSIITSHGLCWSLLPNPTINLLTKTEHTGGNIGFFTDIPSGLSPVTKYYVRAYASNAIDTDYGNEVMIMTPPVLATILTTNVTVGSASVATGGGQILKDGGAPVTERGLVWSTLKGFNPETDPHDFLQEVPLSSGTTFTVQMTGLKQGITYYVRAYAVNAAGTAYGLPLSFSIQATSPVLNTLAVNNIKGVVALGGGEIVSDGGSALIRSGVCWSTHENPTIDDPHTSNGTAVSTFSSSLTGLQPNTHYWVRAYAENGVGIGYGLPLEFITATVPTLTATGPISNILSASATAAGEITDTGRLPILARGFVWSIYNDPLKAGTNKTVDKTSALAEKFSATLNNGLLPDTHYFVWAYASNEIGTTYASPADLQTMKLMPPSVITQPLDAGLVTGNSAPIAAAVIDDGGDAVTTRGVCWSTSPDPVYTLTTRISSGSGIGAFNTLISGLQPKTHYYVRAYAKNSIDVAYSAPAIEFTTAAVVPTLSVVTISNIKMTGSDASASILNDGGDAVTERGFIWSTGAVRPLADNTNSLKITDTNAPFTGSIANLLAGVKYYVWAYAINGAGTGFSATPSVLSTPSMATVITNTPVSVTASSAKVGGNVTNTGGSNITERGIYWGTTNPLVHDDAHKLIFVTGSTTTGSFTIDLLGLSKGTDYWVQAYAINAADTAYGNTLQFKTWTIPSLTTTKPKNYNISAGTAVGGGNITLDGGTKVLTRGILWSDVETDPAKVFVTSNKTTENILSGTGLGIFTANMSGLLVGKTYNVWAYATNAVGQPAFGDIQTLVTPASLPVLSAITIESMTNTTADISAKVTFDGGAPVDDRGLIWNTTGIQPASPDLAENILPDSSPGSNINGQLGGLIEGPTYYVWAYASNSAGTAFSLVESFKICPTTFSVTHSAALNGPPVDKTVLYHSVSSKISGAARCWITQNLGADREATAANDNTELSRGWFWQFNRSQGYKHDGNARTPSTGWVSAISESGGWTADNDPCNLFLGPGWRIPSISEWKNVIANNAAQYNSVLKLANTGYVSTAGLNSPGYYGMYWSSSQVNDNTASVLNLTVTNKTYTYNKETYATPLRCLRDIIALSKPYLSVLTIDLTQGEPQVSAAVTSDGGDKNTVRGFIWNTTGTFPGPADNILTDAAKGTGLFTAALTGMIEGPTYYVYAFATNNQGTSYSQVESFKICPTFTVDHAADPNGAPLSKTVTYHSVSTRLSGTVQCWLTQNLGASNQADAVNDSRESSAGWYFQFNRSAGYQYTTSRLPNSSWLIINETGGWELANDPCNTLIGGGWRLPTRQEWINVDGAPQNWTSATHAFNSTLKLHTAGVLAAGAVTNRGSVGYYWSSDNTNNSSSNGDYLSFVNGGSPASGVGSISKSNALPVRCLRETVAKTPPKLSLVSLDKMTFSTVDASASVTSDGGASPVSDRGFIWNTTGISPVNLLTPGDVRVSTGSGSVNFMQTINGLKEGPTYYIWAYAINSQGFGCSEQPSSFKLCPEAFSVNHIMGVNGVPVTKSITYHSVSTKLSGADRCWITQNLGADKEAASMNDQDVLSRGWYYQFNRSQGYQFDTFVQPMLTWVNPISEAGDWADANDPCRLQLGGGWRLPTKDEWTSVDAGWKILNDAYNSVLKIHTVGYILSNGRANGNYGYYWSSSSNSNTNGWILNTYGGENGISVITSFSKTNGLAIRCLRDAIVTDPLTLGPVSIETTSATTVDATASVTLSEGNTITDRGICWSSSSPSPTIADNRISDGAGSGPIRASINGLVTTAAKVYYARAYATNSLGQTAYGPPALFRVCPPVTVAHQPADNVSPVSKTVTYKAVTSTISGSPKCWITQNLGASVEAADPLDKTEAAAGWYWQFNRAQAYKHDGITRTPSVWNNAAPAAGDWIPANDPCSLLLGSGWRLPTYAELQAVAAVKGFGFFTPLKVHAPGILTSGTLGGSGSSTYFWSGTASNSIYGYSLTYIPSNGNTNPNGVMEKVKNALPIRCLKD